MKVIHLTTIIRVIELFVKYGLKIMKKYHAEVKKYPMIFLLSHLKTFILYLMYGKMIELIYNYQVEIIF
jgi:hypothetical protein